MVNNAGVDSEWQINRMYHKVWIHAVFFLDLWLDGTGNPEIKGFPKTGIIPGALSCLSTGLAIRQKETPIQSHRQTALNTFLLRFLTFTNPTPMIGLALISVGQKYSNRDFNYDNLVILVLDPLRRPKRRGTMVTEIPVKSHLKMYWYFRIL